MTEQPGPTGAGKQSSGDDETVRVREQTANDLGSPDAFGGGDDATGGDSTQGGTDGGDEQSAAARYQVPED